MVLVLMRADQLQNRLSTFHPDAGGVFFVLNKGIASCLGRSGRGPARRAVATRPPRAFEVRSTSAISIRSVAEEWHSWKDYRKLRKVSMKRYQKEG